MQSSSLHHHHHRRSKVFSPRRWPPNAKVALAFLVFIFAVWFLWGLFWAFVDANPILDHFPWQS